MKLFIEDLAPNARRVLMFLAEKNLELEIETLDFNQGEHKSSGFLKKNPLGQVPVLELDNGSCISESVSICRYLEEICPRPILLGDSASERAQIDMWLRRVESGVFVPAVEYGHHTSPIFEGMMDQIPQVGSYNKFLVEKMWRILDTQLAQHEFVSGTGFSIADITAYLGTVIGLGMGLSISDLKYLKRWYKQIGNRASAESVSYE